MTEEQHGTSPEAGEQVSEIGSGPSMAAEEPEAPTRKPEGRLSRFLRRALRLLVGVVVLYGLGVATLWVVQVRPLRQQVDQLELDLESARAEIDGLQGQVADLTDDVEALSSENEALTTELQEAEARLALLSVLVDVTTARLAIAQERPIEAKAALEFTSETLVKMGEKLGPDHSGTVEGLQERLALVLEEVDVDVFAAQRDLEILANTLVGIDRDLFTPD